VVAGVDVDILEGLGEPLRCQVLLAMGHGRPQFSDQLDESMMRQ